MWYFKSSVSIGLSSTRSLKVFSLSNYFILYCQQCPLFKRISVFRYGMDEILFSPLIWNSMMHCLACNNLKLEGTNKGHQVVSCDEGTPQPSLLQAEETKWPQLLIMISLDLSPSWSASSGHTLIACPSCIELPQSAHRTWGVEQIPLGKYSTKFVQNRLLSLRTCECSKCSREMGVGVGCRSCCLHGWCLMSGFCLDKVIVIYSADI